MREPLLVDLLRAGKNTVYPGVDFDDVIPPSTQVFRFSDEVTTATVAQISSPSFVFPDISDVRLPYDKVVIEMPRINISGHRTSEEGSVTVTRVAAYIQTYSHPEFGRGFIFWPFWEGVNGKISGGAVSVMWCEHMPPIDTIKVHAWSNKNSFITVGTSIPKFIGDVYRSKGWEVEAGLNHYINQIQNNKTQISDSVEELPLLLVGAHLIMNCKTGLSKTKVSELTPQAPKGIRYGKAKQKLLRRSGFTAVHLSECEQVDFDGNIFMNKDIALKTKNYGEIQP